MFEWFPGELEAGVLGMKAPQLQKFNVGAFWGIAACGPDVPATYIRVMRCSVSKVCGSMGSQEMMLLCLPLGNSTFETKTYFNA